MAVAREGPGQGCPWYCFCPAHTCTNPPCHANTLLFLKTHPRSGPAYFVSILSWARHSLRDNSRESSHTSFAPSSFLHDLSDDKV